MAVYGKQRKEEERPGEICSGHDRLALPRSASTPPVALNRTIGVIWKTKVSPDARGEPVLA